MKNKNELIKAIANNDQVLTQLIGQDIFHLRFEPDLTVYAELLPELSKEWNQLKRELFIKYIQIVKDSQKQFIQELAKLGENDV